MSITPAAGSAGLLDSTSTRTSHTLPLVTLFLIGLFIFTIGIRVNYTNIDEAYFSDPVINLLTAHGYTSSSWSTTSPTETHVSTAPAYSLLLLGWFKFLGVSQVVERCLSAGIAIAGTCVFWLACRRWGLVKSGMAGALLFAVAILDYGYAYSYSVGRPDALSALWLAVIFYFSTLQNRKVALELMGLFSLGLPFVQWSCVIYVSMLSAALILIIRTRVMPFVVAVGLGVAAGLLLQRMLYAHWGLWDTWMCTVKSEGSESIIQRISQRMSWHALVHNHSNTIPKDFSALLVLCGLVWVYFLCRLRSNQAGAALARSALIIAAVVSMGMYFIGKFPTYYGWMISLPLAAVMGACYDHARAHSPRMAGLVITIAGLGCLAGLPLQAGLASHDWPERQPGRIAAWLAPRISRNDIVYCDYPFYFIAKQRARQVYTGRYFGKMSDTELKQITLVIVGHHGSDWNQTKRPLTNYSVVGVWQAAKSGLAGNDWQYGILSAPNYDCTVYQLNTPDHLAGETRASPLLATNTPVR